MCILELSKKRKYQISEYITKMNTKTVRELRHIAKDQNLVRYYKLWKTELIALLSEKVTQKMPTLPSRSKEYKRMVVHPVKLIPHPKEIGSLEEHFKNWADLVNAVFLWMDNKIKFYSTGIIAFYTYQEMSLKSAT